MDREPSDHTDDTRIGALASRAFGKIEIFAYIVLGLLFALTALLGIASPDFSHYQSAAGGLRPWISFLA